MGGQALTESFEILKDPRIEASHEDLQAQFELHIQIRDLLSEVNATVNRLRSIRAQVGGWVERAAGRPGADEVAAAAQGLEQRLSAVEGKLTRVLGPNPMNLPPKTLDLKLAALTNVAGTSDFAPTRQAYEVFNDLKARVDSELATFLEITTGGWAAFLSLVERMDVPK